MAAISTAFPDILDPRFQKVFNEQYKQEPDRIGEFFDVMGGDSFPTKDTARFTQVGTFGDFLDFTGNITYDDVNQGYDVTMTHKEYASGFQIERKLYDDDVQGVIDQKPRGLGTAAQRTRQKHAASLFTNAFSVDTTWLNHTEAVALCSDSHTTTSTASTASGFDNRITASLSAVSVTAANIQMRGFRGDRAERITITPSAILYPINLYDVAYEIAQSEGKPDTANNNANVHEGTYDLKSWIYLTDVNDWFMLDTSMQKQWVKWIDRVSLEFGMVEDFDSLVGKWRAYMRYSLGWIDWRWILGSQVS